MSDVVIDLINVNKHYEDFQALNNILLQVKKGQIFGYLGPNGAGKTTTIKLILGLMNISHGTIKVLNGNPHPDTIEAFKIRFKLGSMLESNGLFENLSGLNNLIFWAGLYGIDKQAGYLKAMNLLNKVNLDNVSDVKVSKYSFGMKKRLNLARSLISDPSVLVLDEPTMGVDPESKYLIRKIIKEFANQGKTVFFSSHDLEEVQKICSHIALIKDGKIMFNGTLNELIEQFGSSKLYIRLNSSESAINLRTKLQSQGYEIKQDDNLLIFYPKKGFNILKFSDHGIIDSWSGETSLEEAYFEIIGEAGS